MHIIPVDETKVSLGKGQSISIRTLMLQNRREPFTPFHEIFQLHYDGWPDFGRPTEAATIVSLVKTLDNLISQRGKCDDAPILVHCSAGCGRTGTFCTVDNVIHSLDGTEGGGRRSGGGEEVEDFDIIYQNVLALREQRMSLVQTLRQYVLCYDCVLYHLLEEITCDGGIPMGDTLVKTDG